MLGQRNLVAEWGAEQNRRDMEAAGHRNKYPSSPWTIRKFMWLVGFIALLVWTGQHQSKKDLPKVAQKKPDVQIVKKQKHISTSNPQKNSTLVGS